MTVATITAVDKYEPLFPGMPRTADQILITATTARKKTLSYQDLTRQGGRKARQVYFSAEMSCLNAGVSREDFWCQAGPLLELIFPPGRHDPAKKMGWMIRDWDRAQQAVTRQAADTEAWTSSIWQALNVVDWTQSRSRETDHVVLVYLIEKAAARYRHQACAAVRAIARDCGISTTTVQRSLDRLEAAGWLERLPRRQGAVTVVRVRIPDVVQTQVVEDRQAWYRAELARKRAERRGERSGTPPGGPTACVGTVSLRSIERHSIYRRGGSGTKGRFLHQYLAGGPRTLAQVQAALGYRHRASARRRLAREMEMGLVHTDGCSFWLADDMTAARDLAAAACTAEVQRRVESRMQHESDWWRERAQVQREVDQEARPRRKESGGLVSKVMPMDAVGKRLRQRWAYDPDEPMRGIPRKFRERDRQAWLGQLGCAA